MKSQCSSIQIGSTHSLSHSHTANRSVLPPCTCPPPPPPPPPPSAAAWPLSRVSLPRTQAPFTSGVSPSQARGSSHAAMRRHRAQTATSTGRYAHLVRVGERVRVRAKVGVRIRARVGVGVRVRVRVRVGLGCGLGLAHRPSPRIGRRPNPSLPAAWTRGGPPCGSCTC